jgi:NAD(P)-dependent dehydrogenase (short-subunit alcohol dehydrogenase family)
VAGRLDGKVALLSGGARGQGQSHTRLFVAEGAKVVLGDVLDEEGEKVAALELGADWIHVNSLHPGMVDTPMITGDDPDSVDDNASMQRQPIKRMARPDEMPRMVLCLATDESAYCTGADFVADAGSTAGSSHEGLAD